jgi:hypothetical protein
MGKKEELKKVDSKTFREFAELSLSNIRKREESARKKS